MNLDINLGNVITIALALVAFVVATRTSNAVLTLRVDRLEKEVEIIRGRTHEILNAIAKLDIKVEVALRSINKRHDDLPFEEKR